MATVELIHGLNNDNRNYLVFEHNGNIILGAVSPYLADVDGIVNFDDESYMLTFLAKNSKTDEVVEDYWDLMFELESLGMDDKKDAYFGGLKTEDICIRRK